MVLGMLLLPALLAVAVVAVFWMLRRASGIPGRSAHDTDPLKELESRYARGEIARRQFLEMKQDIDEKRPQPKGRTEGSLK